MVGKGRAALFKRQSERQERGRRAARTKADFETSIGETKLELKDADLFANPGAGDFRVKPMEYAAFGDPRWEK